jgi:hypothetical protein
MQRFTVPSFMTEYSSFDSMTETELPIKIEIDFFLR